MPRRRRLLIDLAPVRESPAFRRLLAGTALSSVGNLMTDFAVALQVWTLTRSSLAVGTVGLITAVVAVLVGPVGGSLADAVDRRGLVLVTTSGLAVVSAGLAAQAFLGSGSLRLLYGLIGVQALLSAVNGPAARTFLARLLPPERIAAGAALRTFAFHGSVTVGPALAGLITAAWGLRICYLVDAASFGAALYAVARLPRMAPAPGARRPGPRAIVDGLRFVRHHGVIAGAFLADLNATVLGMPIALFPAVNAAHFGGSPRALGLLAAGPAIGGIAGSVLSGPVGQVRRQGRSILGCTVVWGAGLIGFGLAGSLWVAVAALVLAGAADVISVVFRTTIVQTVTPDPYRGRVSALEHVVGASCPDLGNFRAGALASLTTPALSAVIGGLSTIAGAAAIGASMPSFRRYRAGGGEVCS